MNKYTDEDWPWFLKHLGWVFLGFFALLAAGIGVDQWWGAANNVALQDCANTIFYSHHTASCAQWALRHSREGLYVGIPVALGVFGAICSGVGFAIRWADRRFP